MSKRIMVRLLCLIVDYEKQLSSFQSKHQNTRMTGSTLNTSTINEHIVTVARIDRLRSVDLQFKYF